MTSCIGSRKKSVTSPSAVPALLGIAFLAALLTPAPAEAVHTCGGVSDTCSCGGVPNPCICDSSGCGNCVWYAWHQACCSWGTALSWCTDAETWDEYAGANGYATGSVPQAGSIFVRQRPDNPEASDNGHVGWVEEVYPNGSFYITHQAYGGWSDGGCGVRGRTVGPGTDYPNYASTFIYASGSGPEPPADADGDGHASDADCDDADAAVHPGAAEACNGRDDDCDGETDEGCTDGCGPSSDCTPGDTDAQACGLCGRQTRSCTSGCAWGDWSACADEGVCAPGENESRSCGDCASQTRTCTGACAWGDWGGCTDGGVCSPGESETRSCGDCGSQTRTCASGCAWGDWGTCTGVGVCSPGETQSQNCGTSGTQSRTCTDGCAWGAWGSCTGGGECTPGTSSPCAECGRVFCGSDGRWIRDGSGDLCCSMLDQDDDNVPDTGCGYLWQSCSGCGSSDCWQFCDYAGTWYPCQPM